VYDIESLPADIDGDGQIALFFSVAGERTGIERLNAGTRGTTRPRTPATSTDADRWDEKASLRRGVPRGLQLEDGLEAQEGG
jgi:hypothetical protein